MKYVITGGNELKGEVRISGNKNSVFPCMAAALLTSDEVILENVPSIRDVEVLIQILSEIGVEVTREGSVVVLKAANFKAEELSKELVTKLRGSVVLVGAILARLGKVRFYHPGGDIIGRRSIETHLEGFEALGAKVRKDDLEYSVKFTKESESDKECSVFLSEASVTATENIILASCLGDKKIVIKNCPSEPHIVDLCQMLIKMGAKIEGCGTNSLIVEGVKNLKGVRFRLGPDYVEAGTYIVAAAITGGEVTITNIDDTDIDPVILPLSKFGIQIERKPGQLTVKKSRLNAVPKLQTNIWPGFPTDIMSIAIVLATQSRGVSLCHDWMYESRMFFVDKLIAMGANITLADPHRVFVYGPTKLKPRELESPDIRAGMALVLAALVAKGTSVINKAELIERGYEDVEGKLKKLGAVIERVES